MSYCPYFLVNSETSRLLREIENHRGSNVLGLEFLEEINLLLSKSSMESHHEYAFRKSYISSIS